MRSRTSRTALLVLSVIAAACNAILGMDDVGPVVPDTAGSAGKAAAGGQSGAGRAGGAGRGGSGASLGGEGGNEAGSGGESASAGAGAPDASCTQDETQCESLEFQLCGADQQWHKKADCDVVCDAMKGCVDSCETGKHQCNGDRQLDVCDDGAFVKESTCPYVCTGDECAGECVPGTRDCEVLTARSCGSDGKWDRLSCDLACLKGACVECNPDEERCADGGAHRVERCQADGTWKRLTDCRTDDSDCGPCPVGETCGDEDSTGCASDFCLDGLCEATSCGEDEDCASQHCTLSYQDLDGDGYGTTSDVAGRCDGTIPNGYAEPATDCCDDASDATLSAKIYPGQTDWFKDAASLCGIAYDYDCSGAEERKPLASDCDADCNEVETPRPTNACAGAYGVTVCSGASGSCTVSGAGPVTQLCH